MSLSTFQKQCLQSHDGASNPLVLRTPFKEGITGKGPALWSKMFHYYNYKREDFDAHYHERSNIETVFSMVKMKFGTHLRSKTKTAQINELHCKFLCHNICVLISSIYELGLVPEFWQDSEVA